MNFDVKGMGDEGFKDFTSRRLLKVADDVSELLTEQLQQVYWELIGFQEFGHPSFASTKCRRANPQRISLDDLDDSEDFEPQEAEEANEAEVEEAKVQRTHTDLQRMMEGRQRRPRNFSDVSQVSQVSWADSRSSDNSMVDVKQVDASSGINSGITSPMAMDLHRIELHELWKQDDEMLKSRMTGRTVKKLKVRRRGSMEWRSGMEVKSKGCWKWIVMRPNSPQCLLWDVFCAMAIIHDMVMIPLVSAFPIDRRDPVIRSLELVSSFIWFADIPLTFVRGFLDTRRGIFEMRLRFIALHYAKGWLWIDASLASVDLVSYLSLDDAMEVLTLLRLVRNLRVLRLFKMMSRLAVLRETMMSIDSRLESGPTSSIFLETSLVVVKQLGVIALLCHFTGCAWYTLGREALEVGRCM
eukprot:g33444.t1